MLIICCYNLITQILLIENTVLLTIVKIREKKNSKQTNTNTIYKYRLFPKQCVSSGFEYIATHMPRLLRKVCCLAQIKKMTSLMR